MTQPPRAGRLLVLALALAAPARARAQVVASLAATADVDATVLAIGVSQTLRFGTVTPGTPLTINPKTSPSAAVLVVQGAKNAEIAISFTLPTALTVGPYSMPLSFGATSACGRPSSVQSGCTAFDPSAPFVDRIRNQNPPNNHYYVWLGGTVSPAAAQQGGVYYATVSMTVAYTGN